MAKEIVFQVGLDYPDEMLQNLATAFIYVSFSTNSFETDCFHSSEIPLKLEEPEQDGQTAFARLHLAVKPVKGSVVFNYQLLNSGKVDKMMSHGGCPLVSRKKLSEFCLNA